MLNRQPKLRELTLVDMEMLDYPGIEDCDFRLVQQQLDRFELVESMSDKIFELWVDQFSTDKRRRCYFDVSGHKLEVMAGDANGVKQVKEEFKKFETMYHFFAAMMPKQLSGQLGAPMRGILSNIPVTFSFRVLTDHEEDQRMVIAKAWKKVPVTLEDLQPRQ